MPAMTHIAICPRGRVCRSVDPHVATTRMGVAARCETELPMTTDLPRTAPRRWLAHAIVLSALCASGCAVGAFPTALAADAPATGVPPNLDLSTPGVAWAGFVAPKAPD